MTSPLSTEILFGFSDKHPYYIYAPPIKIHSAGVLVLHRLCHLLNCRGLPAFMVVDRNWLGKYGYPPFPGSSGLITPMLTTEMARQHFAEGKTPIVVYPESIEGSPLGGGLEVRYLLNYLGHLGGEQNFREDVLYYSYSKKIASQSPAPENVLFIPVSNPEFFVPPQVQSGRSGKCFWAAKYQHFHHQKVGPEVEGAFEITRDLPTSLTKAQLRDLFQKSEIFYCYENTALAIEAALCGCPVAFVPNPYLTEVIGEDELSTDGFAFGIDEASIQKAKDTVHLFREKYLRTVANIPRQLDAFIELSQRQASRAPRDQMVALDKLLICFGNESAIPSQYLRKIETMNRILRERGFKSLIRSAIGRALGRMNPRRLLPN